MRNISEEHKKHVTDKIIVFTENKRTIRFKNPDQLKYIKVHIDGEAIKIGERCDYLLTSGNEREEYFIELKGEDIMKAASQLKTTIQNVGEFTDNRNSYIICTNVAPALTTKIQYLKKEFNKQFNSKLEVKSRQLEVSLKKMT